MLLFAGIMRSIVLQGGWGLWEGELPPDIQLPLLLLAWPGSEALGQGALETSVHVCTPTCGGELQAGNLCDFHTPQRATRFSR